MTKRQPLETYGGLGLGMILALTGTLLGAAQVQEIPRNWSADSGGSPSMRRVLVARANASSTFASEGGQYAPGRAVDGNRGTKWVASVAPSQAEPQWITLEFFGAQEVNAVAVFGERIDNDGILDAQVQVSAAEGNEYTTVATTENANSSSWLATFDPVKTTAVRLLITRSSGPSPHTDVYEIEIYGTPLSAAEQRRVRRGTT